MVNKYLIDTCVIIDLFRKRASINPSIFEKGSSLSVITLSELYYGASKSADKKHSLEQIESFVSDFDLEIIDFDKKAAVIFGNLKSELEKTGEKLDDMDLLIAASAIAENKVFVTNNLKHFTRIKKLKVVLPN